MTPPDLIPATPAHARAMASIHAAAFAPLDRWGPDALALQLDLPGAFGLIDLAGGLVLARVAADEAEILTLAVARPLHRRGIGRRLLAAAEVLAADAGAATLFLEVAEANAAGRALYAGRGYLQVGRRPRYYTDGSDALVLRRALSGGAAAGG